MTRTDESPVDHLVRIVRGVQGASSGRDTTKYEFIYGTMFQTRVNLRVHALSKLDATINHDGAYRQDQGGNIAQLWTATSYSSGVPKDDIDAKDFNYWDTSVPGYLDWTESSSPVRGRFEYFYRESRPLTAMTKEYLYRDQLTAGSIGRFGRRYESLASTTDGVDDSGQPINDGGCVTNDPESSVLRYARLDVVLFPQVHAPDPTEASQVVADDFAANIASPMTYADREEYENGTPPPPITPCLPAAPTAAGDNNGAANLTINKGGCDSSLGFRIYRGSGASGPLLLLADVGTGTGIYDLKVATGSTYRYAVSSYNDVNQESAMSAVASVTVTDTTPPSIPGGLATTSGDQTATVTWFTVDDRDLYGYDIYMSQDGGPYVKMNGSTVPAYIARSWSEVGLMNGSQYCFKIVAVDYQGNASAMSAAECATPGP